MKFKAIILMAMVLLVIMAINGAATPVNDRGEVTIAAILTGDNTQARHPGVFLNDGKPDTYWAVNPGGEAGWAELHLREPALIHGLEISGSLGNGNMLVMEYRQEDGYWNTFLAGSLRSIPATGTVDLSYDRIVTGTLRLRITGANPEQARLNEVNVWGRPAKDSFHRINPRSVAASGHTSYLTRAEFLTDGNTNTYWMVKPRYRSGNNWLFETIETYLGIPIDYNYDFNWPGRPAYANYGEVLFDLGGPHTITNINLFFTKDARGDLILEGETGGQWTKLGVIPKPAQPGWRRLALNNPVASRIRLTVEAPGHESVGGLGEVEFWGYGGYHGNWGRELGPENVPLTAAINREFKLKKAAGRDHRLDLAVENSSGETPAVEVNGREYLLTKSFELHGQAVFSLALTDAMLDDETNYLRIKPQTGTLTGLKLVRGGDGVQPHQTPALNDGLVLTAGSRATEAIVALTQTTLVEQVEVYRSGEAPLSLSYQNGAEWVTIHPVSETPGYLRYQNSFTTGRLKLNNPAGVEINELRVLGSPVTDGAPSVRLLRPEDYEVFDCDQLSDKYLVGFVDNPRATVKVGGKDVFQIGHYFGCHLTAIGAKTWEETEIEAVATDPQGRVGRTKTSILIDKLPWFTVDQPETTVTTANAVYQLSGDLKKPNSVLKVNGQPVADKNGRFTAQVALAEGLNLIKVECVYTKPGADSFTQTVYRKVVRDSGQLQLTITSPLTSIRTSAASLTVTGKVYGPAPVNVWVNEQPAAVDGADFQQQVGLTEGENTITVRARDGRNRVTAVTLAVRRDSTAPLVTVIQPVDQSIVNSAAVTVEGTIADASPVFVLVNGILAELDDGRFRATLTLPEGWNQISVKAQDGAGNVSEKILKLLVDTVAPLAFTPTAEPSGWTNDNRPVIRFATSDETSGIDHYEIRVGEGAWITPVTSPYQFAALHDGEQTVRVKAVDRAGNAAIGEVKVYIDTVPPAAPADFEVISGIGRVILKWREVDASGETVGYRIRRSPAFAGGAVKDLYRPAELEDLNQFSDDEVNPGVSYSYAIQAIDHAGNIGALTAALTTKPGSVSQTVDSGGGMVKFDNVEITFPQGALSTGGQVVVTEAGSLPDNTYATKAGRAYQLALLDGEGEEIEAEFAEPVNLKISYADLDLPSGFTEDDLGIYWYNRSDGYWEKLDYAVFDYAEATIAVDLNHFSEYQLMASKYVSPSLDSYYNMGVAPFQSYFQNNVENVSPTSGSLAVSAFDLSLPGRTGNGLAIQRIYDSAAAQQEKMIEANKDSTRKTPVDTFGSGWSLNIPWIERTDKGKFIRLPQGQTIKIEVKKIKTEEGEIEPAKGTFEYHKGVHFRLDFDPSGFYLTMNDGSRYEFDKNGKVVRYLDPSGKNALRYEYNGRELAKIVHLVDEPAGTALYTVQFKYQNIDGAGKRLIESITAGDRTVRYRYNASGVLSEVADPLNRKTVYLYETHTFRQGVKANSNDIFSYSVPLLKQIIYPTGEKSTYTYDLKDQGYTETITKKSFFGLIKKKKDVRYEGTKSMIAQRLTADKRTTYSYEMNDSVGSIKKGDFVPAHTYLRSTRVTEGSRTLEYIFRQIEGDKLTVTPKKISNYNGPLTIETVTKIDNGREIERITFDYDVPKRSITVQRLYRGGEMVARISSQYDNWGNLKYRWDGSRNLEETWSYYNHTLFKNLPASYTQKSHNPVKNSYATVTTTYQYDSALGKPLVVTVNDGSGNKVTRFAYDRYGNVKTKVDEYNDHFKTEIFYDDFYQTYPVKQVIYGVRDAEGDTTDIVTETGYDYQTGLKRWEKDPRGFITRYEYDKLNRVLKVTLPDDDREETNNPYREYVFDDEANTCEFFNENGQKTSYRFDGLGRLNEVVQDTSLYAGGVKTGYQYNNLGQISKVTDPRGKETTYEYDGLNRVTKVTYPGGAFATLSYDDATNTVTVTDENGGQVKERKDWANRLVEAKQYEVYGNDAKTHTWSFVYDSLGNKLHSFDPLLNRTEQEYNPLGQVIRTTLPTVALVLPGKTLPEPYQPKLTYEYDAMGNRIAEVSANGNATGNGNHRVEYQYDQLGRKIKTTTQVTEGVSGEVVIAATRVFYDAAGNMAKTVDPRGGVRTYTYAARGWLLSETDPAGNTIRYQYDVLGNKIAVTDPRGDGTNGKFTTWYVYDDLNRLYRTVLPDTTPPANPYLNPEDNPYTEITYDVAGNKVKERDANGVTTSYEYTDRNWLWKVSDAKGRVQTEYVYDKKGNQIEVKDILGRTVKKSYDSLGRLRKVTDALHHSESYSYDAVGNKTSVTDARGNTTYIVYNSLGWQTSVKNALGNSSQYRYDANGNRVETVAPNGLSTKVKYDELNRVIETRDSLGQSTRFSFDINGNQRWSQDRRGTQWVYQYDDNNRLQRAEATGKDGSGYWVEYQYDPVGNPIKVKDSGNEINYNLVDGVYQSDPLNRVNQIERRFDGATYRTAYQYDKAGLVKGILYPEARSMVEYTYNDLNQLTEVTGFTATNGINYNIDGSLQRLTYANGAAAVYGYDPSRRLDRLQVTIAGQELLNLKYTYDEVSNIKTVTDSGKIKTYEYDKNNQLLKAVIPGTFMETTPTPGTAALKTGDILGNSVFEFMPVLSGLMGLDYYASSIGIDFGSVAPGVKRVELAPDKNHATHRINENTIALYVSADNMNYTLIPRTNWEYQKDAKGIITLTLKEKLATRYLKLHVKYDERGRDFEPVNKATFLNEIAQMLRIYQEATARTEEYQYDAAGNRKLARVTLVQTAELASQYYTHTDRLKTDGMYALAYDNAGNMVKKGNVYTINGDTVNFTASGEGVEYWEYKYDLLNRLIKVTKNSKIVSEYAYDPGGLRVVKKAKGETTHYVFQGTEPIFEKRISAGKSKSYVYALGKYLARVDGVIGAPEAKKYYYHTDHLGSIRVITDQAGKVVYNADYLAFGTQFAKDGDFEELHGFTGKEYDPDIGLYYFNARWYDPDLGRFISEDPAADPNNPNLYVYCGNSPVMRVDPTGKFWWIAIGAILGGLDAHLNGGDFMQGFVMGAVTGAIGAGVSSFVSSAWGATLGSQMVSGAIAGGITGELFGEGFGKGAVYGAVAGAISYGVDTRFKEYAAKSVHNKVVIAGLKGGLNGLARGGDFIEGFGYGAAYGFAYEYVENNFVAAYAEGEPSKTVKTIAKKAGGCGRLFSDPDQAALDFAMRYNDDSIRSGREYGASIFVVLDGNGKKWYTYTIPNRGVEHMVVVSAPKNHDTVIAEIHTHGKFDTSFQYEDDFSKFDMEIVDDRGVASYLATPTGKLRYYSQAEGFRLISTSIPSDPNAGKYRVNNISPFTNMKDDTFYNPWFTNFWLNMIQQDNF